MAGSRNAPELFRPNGGFVDAFGVPAGNVAVARVADEKDRERPRTDGALRRDVLRAEAAFLFGAVDSNDGRRAKQRLAEQRAQAQTRIVVGDFPQTAEGTFGDDGLDARLDCGGLERDRSAHGFP